jgi:hypothetical protein
LEDYVRNLYLDTSPPKVEKTAAEIRLSDSADTWPREVLKELLKQHPYLGSYEINPVMQRADGEQGYGTGFFQVYNRSATPMLGAGTKSQMALQGVKFIRIPIIIKSTKLQDLDIFLAADGDTQHLTDERVRAALFRPQVFDTPRTSPGDAPMADVLYPPTSRQHAMTGGQVTDASSMAGQTKVSSAKPKFLLEAIGPTISIEDINSVAQEMQKNAQLRAALTHNESTLPFLKYLGSLEPTTSEDVEKVAMASVMPDVLQIERDGERYLYKEANSSEFDPEVAEADRHTLADQAGEDLIATVDRHGAATISTNPVVHKSLEDEEISPIDYFGQYRVKGTDGKELMGWVFPTVLDFDGIELPWKIFTNGSQSNVQDDIVGSFAGKSTNIIQGSPSGYGFFYHITSSGSVVAFQPIELQGRSGDGFMAETMMGDPVNITFNKDLSGPVTADGTVTLPSSVRWAPLGEERVKLIDNAADFIKRSLAKKASTVVRIVSDKNTWSFSGSQLEKVAHRWREQLHAGDAMFVAAALGLEPNYATDMLVKAAKEGSVLVHGCRRLGTRKEKLAAARSEVEELLGNMPKKKLMLKEAAALEDVTTVDKVLSLGFLNPENLQTFIQWLPDLEKAQCELAGLLLATRLGLEDVPESSTKAAMERVDDVINGLKKLLFRRKGAVS